MSTPATESLVLYDWGGANRWLFSAINSHTPPALDGFWRALSALGDHHLFGYYFFTACAWTACLWVYGKQRKRADYSETVRGWAGVLAVMMVGYTVLALSVGFLGTFTMPRPYVVFYPNPIHLGEVMGKEDFYKSFPSSHSAFITFITLAFWPKLAHRHAKSAAIILIALVCIARVALGMHFPADVAGGVVIGAAVIFFVRRYVYRLLRISTPPAIVRKPLDSHLILPLNGPRP